MQEESIFTKIVKGEIPCYKIYEDQLTLAFLDIHVIPKIQIEFVWDLPEKDYLAVMETARKVALNLKAKTGAKYVGQQVVGVDVPHAHIHLIPFNDVKDFRHIPDMSSEPDHAGLSEMAKRLSF
jgi:histidine triad (HIT) family protein